MDIRALINRDWTISQETKQNPLTIVFTGLNAISEALLPNLLFRLENRTQPSKIVILNDNAESNLVNVDDTLYSSYQDEEDGYLKSSVISDRYAGVFKTPILDYRGSVYTEGTPYHNENHSVIVIDTIAHRNMSASDIVANNHYLRNNISNIDFAFIQAIITETEEHVAILKNNLTAINKLRLYGDKIAEDVYHEGLQYMNEYLKHNHHKAYLAANRIMNTLNAYITENMNLKYSYSTFNYETLASTYRYFDKSTNILLDLNVRERFEMSDEFLRDFGNFFQKSIDKNRELYDNVDMEEYSVRRSISSDYYTIGDMWENLLDNNYQCRVLKMFLTPQQMENVAFYESVARSVYAVKFGLDTEDLLLIKAVTKAMVDVYKDIMGGRTEW